METEHLWKLQWFDELYELNYLKHTFYHAEITHDGWREIEKHLQKYRVRIPLLTRGFGSISDR